MKCEFPQFPTSRLLHCFQVQSPPTTFFTTKQNSLELLATKFPHFSALRSTVIRLCPHTLLKFHLLCNFSGVKSLSYLNYQIQIILLGFYLTWSALPISFFLSFVLFWLPYLSSPRPPPCSLLTASLQELHSPTVFPRQTSLLT